MRRGGRERTAYCGAGVPGGKARRPHALCTSSGYESLHGVRYFLACAIASLSLDCSLDRTSSMYCWNRSINSRLFYLDQYFPVISLALSTHGHSPEVLLVLIAPRQCLCHSPIPQALPYPAHLHESLYIHQILYILFLRQSSGAIRVAMPE